MILFAQTWDTMGGQMGYNSLGNIFFFGAGMYISAIVQVGLVYDVGVYTSAAGRVRRPSRLNSTIRALFTAPSRPRLAQPSSRPY